MVKKAEKILITTETHKVTIIRRSGPPMTFGADGDIFTTDTNETIGGRVLTSRGKGLQNATLILIGGALAQPISVKTGNSGSYQFPAVQTGQNYTVTVSANGYTFANPSQAVFLTSNITDLNFVAN